MGEKNETIKKIFVSANIKYDHENTGYILGSTAYLSLFCLKYKTLGTGTQFIVGYLSVTETAANMVSLYNERLGKHSWNTDRDKHNT